MKLPAAYKLVTLRVEAGGFYPSLGFCTIQEHQLGNGDCFGLYWPVGREDLEPIVVETFHDEGLLTPQFSSLDRFLAAAKHTEEESEGGAIIGTPSLEDDPLSPAACLDAARGHLKSQNVEAAIGCLGTAVSVLPEYTEAQCLLSAQHRRIGQHQAAIKSAIQAIISPPSFGTRPTQIAAWLARQSACPPALASDPIWLHRERLTLKFGGTKENSQYEILSDAIQRYLDQCAFIPALTLMQTYAELMSDQTISFRERYAFNVTEFVAWQREVAQSRYGKSRDLELPD
jgi:tetratricopeptide (TPR) repeat protein